MICSSIAEALGQTAAEPFVVVTGSLHLVGNAMMELGLATSQDETGLNDYWPSHDWSSIRAVTFDVGGTLIEPWPSVGSVYAQIAERHGIRVSAEQLDRQFAAAWKAKRNFGYSMSDWSDVVNQSFSGLAGAPPNDALFSDIYRHFFYRRAVAGFRRCSALLATAQRPRREAGNYFQLGRAAFDHCSVRWNWIIISTR